MTIHAPSDDSELLDRAGRRLDSSGRTGREHGVAPGEPFCGRGVPSIPPPGAFGDASGGLAPHRRDEPTNGCGLFAPFGGPSAACAIVGAAASPIRAARGRR